jgi:hypothetical protein
MKVPISTKKGHVVWDVTFCSLVHMYRRFRSTYIHLHLSTPVMEAVYSSEAGSTGRSVYGVGLPPPRLLRLLVRIPPGACMSVVSVVCCQVEVSATG